MKSTKIEVGDFVVYKGEAYKVKGTGDGGFCIDIENEGLTGFPFGFEEIRKIESLSVMFCIGVSDNDGSRTIETFDTSEKCLLAYYRIKQFGYHLTENDGEKIKIKKKDRKNLFVDVEIWDLDSNSCYFSDIEQHIEYFN